MPQLQPVEGNPFSLQPVSGNPFATPQEKPMSADNAAKMRELYPEEVPGVKLEPVGHNPFKLAPVSGNPFTGKSAISAGLSNAYAPFKPIVEREMRPLKDLEAMRERPRPPVPKNTKEFLAQTKQGLKQAGEDIPRIGGDIVSMFPAISLAGSAGEATEKLAAEKAGVPAEKIPKIAQDTGDVASAIGLARGGKPAPVKPLRGEPPVIEKPVVVTPEGVKAGGATHEQIQPGVPEAQRKFQTGTGKIVGREEGEKIAEKAGQVKPGEGMEPGKLHSEDLLAAKKPPVPPQPSKIFSPDTDVASTQPGSLVKGVADRLYQQRGGLRADYKEFQQWMGKNVKPFFKDPRLAQQVGKKFLDHVDDPNGVPLTSEEQLVFDRTAKPMIEESERNRAEMAALRKQNKLPDKYFAPEEGRGGAIRQRKGVGTPMDRLTGTKTTERPPEGGRSLSTKAGTYQGRNMMALIHNGKRQIVHVNDEGNILDASEKGNPLGRFDEDSKSPVMADGKPARLVEATRKEIESVTGGKVAYHDNFFGTYGTDILQQRRAIRSLKMLRDVKASPDFNLIARAPFTKGGDVPSDWREIPGLPEFKGYRFEPHYAEEIEDFIHNAKFDAGDLDRLDRINRFALNTTFWANPYHAFNMNNAFLVTKGLGGLAKDLPGTTFDLLKSIKSVATRDKFNMQQARAGVPMRGLDAAGEDFQNMTLDLMGVKMRQDPRGFAQFAKEFGFDDPAKFYSYVSKMSHKATFSWQDVLQQTLERGYQRKGLSRAQATEKIAKTFMDYRSPARVGDKRWMGKALQGQAWLNFPKYAYGRLNGMYNILKGSAKLDPHSLDQLITIGVLYEFGQHVINPWIQQATGNSDAVMSDFGYEVFPELADKLYEGQRTPGQDVQSLLSPGYATQGIMAAYGVSPYLAKPISIPGESPSQVGFDYANELSGKLGPVFKMRQLQSGQITPEDLWLEQIGIKFPTDVQDLKSVKAQLKSRDKHGNLIENMVTQ
jgi:hypothetical protein